MVKIAICPNCGAQLEGSEVYNTRFEDEYIDNYISGYCPICSREFQWVAVYEFAGVEDIEEVS